MGLGGGAVASGGDPTVLAGGALVLVGGVLGLREWCHRTASAAAAHRPLAAAWPGTVAGGFLGAGTLSLLWLGDVPSAAVGLDGLTGEAAGVGVGLGLLLWGLVDLLEVARDRWGPAGGPRPPPAPGDARGWALALGGMIPAVAVGEELLFRGVLVGAPAGWGLPLPALVGLSAVASGLYHRRHGPLGGGLAALVGAGLAAGYVLTGSLLAPVLAHVVVDAGKRVEYSGALAPYLERLLAG